MRIVNCRPLVFNLLCVLSTVDLSTVDLWYFNLSRLLSTVDLSTVDLSSVNIRIGNCRPVDRRPFLFLTCNDNCQLSTRRLWSILARRSTLHFAGAVNTRQKLTAHMNKLISFEFPNRSCRSECHSLAL